MIRTGLIRLALGATLAAACVAVGAAQSAVQLLNVSYDPTRELWRDLNEQLHRRSTRRRRATS